MGRRKMEDEDKKIKISIAIDNYYFEKMKGCKINKSKFINWLLLNYYEEGFCNE